MNSSVSRFRAWAMWVVALLFFAYQFVMRLFPGLVVKDIMMTYQVDALALGFLSSMYYFGYAGMQIPVAVLLDRYGPRTVIAASAALCSLATLGFVLAPNWQIALVARFFIGAGSAAGFLGTSKVISMFFSEASYAKMVGLSFTFGLMGALYGGKPVSLLIDADGWKIVGAIIAGVGFICAFLAWLIIKPFAYDEKKVNEPVKQSIIYVFKNPYIVILAIANLLMVGSLEGFADVWGVSFLSQAFNLQRSEAAFITSFIFIGMLFGGPILASLAARFSAYFLVTASCGFLIALLFLFMFGTFPNVHSTVLCVVLFLIGIFCCYQVLMFAIGTKLSPPQHRGVCIAFLNCINMLGGSFFHLLIGGLLNAFWTGDTINSLKIYSSHNYVMALSAIPVCAFIGGLLVIWIGYKVGKEEKQSISVNHI